MINRSSIGPDPLEGVVHMRVTCRLKNTVEFRGFLTMFDDVSGFGAWHRRWCHLQGTTLNYWKYPDDETKRTPIGSIDLQQCKSTKIGPVPRDICARLNTIMLEVERPSQESDKESLVLVRCGSKTIHRVTLEIYGMVAHREVLPHELKYHILGKKLQQSAKKFMGGTPIKRLRKPIVESPAGPSAKKSNEKSLAQNVLKSLLNNAKGLDVNDSVGSLSDVSGHLEEMEEGLEDALDVSINSSDDEGRDKGSISSSSFLYQRSPVKPVISAIREERYDEDSSDGETRDSPLLHSVSFYRKQQSSQSTCHKTILPQKILEFDDSQEIREEISGNVDSETSEKQLQEKRKKLNDEIHKQQQIISQTSQALNLCAATVEFSGSTEAVEGERHLLVATHRRLAALNELQRINVEKSLCPKDTPPERGSLTITGITIPLAQGYKEMKPRSKMR
uniref:Uncharacterized protein n=1 Tax=Phlebotomus papatasi TaxID=29031 RepID=A0A1B0D533_PHLPP